MMNADSEIVTTAELNKLRACKRKWQGAKPKLKKLKALVRNVVFQRGDFVFISVFLILSYS